MKTGRHVWTVLIIISLSLAGSSCALPSNIPTPTSTTVTTPTIVPPTLTPSVTPTPTTTPIPAYLDIDESAMKGTELVLWHALYNKPKETLDELIARFNEENPYGIHIRAEYSNTQDELDERLIAANTTGSIPSLVISDDAHLKWLYSEGMPLMPLQSYQNSTRVGFDSKSVSPILSGVITRETWNDELFALPLWLNPSLLFYNQTWAVELGYDQTPDSYSILGEQLCAAAKAVNSDANVDNDGTGGWIVNSSESAVMSWLFNFYGKEIDYEQFFAGNGDEIFTPAAEWLRSLQEKGCVWTSRLSEPYDYFANRYTLLYSGTFADIPRQETAFTETSCCGEDLWDVIPYISKTENGKPRDPIILSSAVAAAMLSTDDIQQFAAWHFLTWLLQDEYAASLAIAANAWPSQESDQITSLMKESADPRITRTLGLRQFVNTEPVNADWLMDRYVLSDGFKTIFSVSMKEEEIPLIWGQIQSIIKEIQSNVSPSGNTVSK